MDDNNNMPASDETNSEETKEATTEESSTCEGGDCAEKKEKCCDNATCSGC